LDERRQALQEISLPIEEGVDRRPIVARDRDRGRTAGQRGRVLVRLRNDPRGLVARPLHDLVGLSIHLVEVGCADDRRPAAAHPFVLRDDRLGRGGQSVEELVDVAHPIPAEPRDAELLSLDVGR
jgi:hypothetical protein